MNWTVVHPLTAESPLFEYGSEEMKKADLEIYVSIRGFDDVYSNVVQQRTSYTFNEIIFDKKFVQMYRESDDGKTTIVELHRLDEYKNINLHK
jgi:inward rectifier potassium channel